MLENDYLEIETKFNILLPKKYKELILLNPFRKYKKLQNIIFNEKKQIINVNDFVRINGYFGKKWKNNFFIIGSIRENQFEFIDIKQKSDLDLVIYSLIPEDNKDSKIIKKYISGNDVNDYIQRIIDNMKYM